MAHPKFQELVRQRSNLGWTLAIIMIIIYFGLIALIAFDKPLLATTIGAGPTSLGIVLGVLVILSAAVLVGFYVMIANTRFDSLAADLEREIR